MGLDISIKTNNRDRTFEAEYYDYHGIYSLSRTFCNFMCRRGVINGEPELDQIGKLTSIDISPIYQMEDYGSDGGEELEFFLETTGSEEAKQQILDNAQSKRDELKGNIGRVLSTINGLIERLSVIDNLPGLLDDSGWDTLNYEVYFTEFSIDKGEGYIGNNFGQDLRNFKRLLEYAKVRGATTVYFEYG